MSAEEAFFACTFLDENAQIQLQAEVVGGAIALSEAEARDCAEGTFNPRLFRCCERVTSGSEAGRAPTGKPGGAPRQRPLWVKIDNPQSEIARPLRLVGRKVAIDSSTSPDRDDRDRP